MPDVLCTSLFEIYIPVSGLAADELTTKKVDSLAYSVASNQMILVCRSEKFAVTAEEKAKSEVARRKAKKDGST